MFIICYLGPNVNEFSDSYSGSKTEMINNDQKENCNCTDQPEKKQSKLKDEQQIQIMIEFENNLQNILYVKTYVKLIILTFLRYH